MPILKIITEILFPNPSSNGWEWGESTVAGAHSGAKVWGTRLNSTYPNNANYQLTTPSVYIGSNLCWNSYSIIMNFKKQIMTGAMLKISTNGEQPGLCLLR